MYLEAQAGVDPGQVQWCGCTRFDSYCQCREKGPSSSWGGVWVEEAWEVAVRELA